jgi:hypothetical protein
MHYWLISSHLRLLIAFALGHVCFAMRNKFWLPSVLKDIRGHNLCHAASI